MAAQTWQRIHKTYLIYPCNATQFSLAFSRISLYISELKALPNDIYSLYIWYSQYSLDCQGSSKDNRLAILAWSQMSLQLFKYDHYQLHPNNLGKDCQGVWSNNFVDYKPKYFSRCDKSANSMYFRKIASDWYKFYNYLFTECRKILSESKRKRHWN